MRFAEQKNGNEYEKRPYGQCPARNYGPYSERENAAKKYGLPSELETKMPDDPLSLLSADRRELAWYRVLLLASQIGTRKEMYVENVKGIDGDELVCRNEILRRESMCDYDGAREIDLTQMLRLRQERRKERADVFKDTQRIRQDLVEALVEYKSVVKRNDFVENID